MIRRWVGPNAVGLVMLVVAAVTVGWLAMIVLEDRLWVQVDSPLDAIGWLAITWLTLMPLGRLMTPARDAGRRNGSTTLIAGAIAGVALAFLTAIGLSRAYWGYFLSPPDVDARVLKARSVQSLTYFFKDPDVRDGFYELSGWTTDDIREASTQPVPVADSEGASTGRAAHELARRGILREGPTTLPTTQMAAVFQLMRDTGKLEVEGLGGHAMELTGSDGASYLFVATDGDPGIGGAVSNDHLPYYEFLFKRSADDAPPQLLSFTHFYWDNAGMEGCDWAWMFVSLTPFAFAFTMALAVLCLLLHKLLDREGRRGFPVVLVTKEPGT